MNTKCIFGFHIWKINPDPFDGVKTKSPNLWRDVPKDYKPGQKLHILNRVCIRCGKRQW